VYPLPAGATPGAASALAIIFAGEALRSLVTLSASL